MAEGGSPPLHDSAGLHLFNMNGSSQKMAELVMGDNTVPGNIGLNCSTGTSGMDKYSNHSAAGSFPPDNNMPQSTVAASYLPLEPMGYAESGVYEELKRPGSQLQSPTSPYYSSMDGGGTRPTMFEYSAGADYKPDVPGYVDLLGNPDSMMIKREKLDSYSDSLRLVNSSSSNNIPYPPNTCLPDWNFYNSQSVGNNSFQAPGNQSSQFAFQDQPNQPYNSHMMFNNTQAVHPAPFTSNDEIHFQSKKITESILNSEWGPETIYKSHLYSNLAVDNSGRKRKTDSDKARNSKSRRKKSGELSGHSKTVASILLSEKSGSSKNNSMMSAEILDGSARNSLVSTLMDNIRSTVQFESFCLSFPRSDAKENGFRCKVNATVDMINNLDNQEVKSKPFPSNYLMGANKVVTNFKNALNNTSSNSLCGKEESRDYSDGRNLTMDQVEEHLPHSMVWVVKLCDKTLSANWEGQIVVGVNPIQKLLSISIFQFQPSFSVEGIKCLHQAKLTQSLADDIKQNMEQFEISRQLRCDVDLRSVKQLCLYRPNRETNIGCLILELQEMPQFYQRWLHTSAEDKNKWRPRQNFFTQSETGSDEILCIAGLESELNEIVAMALASDQDIEKLYESGVEHPFQFDGKENCQKNHSQKTNVGSKQEENLKPRMFMKQTDHLPKMDFDRERLRKEISEVLVQHNLIEQVRAESSVSNTGKAKKASSENSLEIPLDGCSCSCFQDFINYSCGNAMELKTLLGTDLKPRAYGFYENDFDMNKVPDENIDKLTIGELLSSHCSDAVYYSFCNREVGQIGYDQHCSKCRQCRTAKVWHCDTCDRCTESRSVCEFCGHLRNDQTQCVIKPLSVFKSQVSSTRVVSKDDIKPEWISSLDQSDDDILILNVLQGDSSRPDVTEYNSSNAMVDQLGLLNPVGFLLGQPSSGAVRKHRRNKGGQFNCVVPHVPSKGGQPSGSGCSLQ